LRSKVEHVFQILKLKFGFVKVRYRVLGKNANRLFCHLLAGEPVYGSQKAAPAGGGIGRGAGFSRTGRADKHRNQRHGGCRSLQSRSFWTHCLNGSAYSEFP